MAVSSDAPRRRGKAGSELVVVDGTVSGAFGRLLHAFNAEFGAATPDADVIAERARP